jgi:hypothetical protein
MSLLSIVTIAKYFFCCFFYFWFSMLLKVFPAKPEKQWLALKLCNVANPVTNSSLTHKHQKHWKTCGYFDESYIQP